MRECVIRYFPIVYCVHKQQSLLRPFLTNSRSRPCCIMYIVVYLILAPPKLNTTNAETEYTASHTDVVILKKRCNIIMRIKFSPVNS